MIVVACPDDTELTRILKLVLILVLIISVKAEHLN